MGLRFGTSGVRGLVSEMTDRECYLYTVAFLRYVKGLAPAREAALAGDLRESTPRIMKAVAQAVLAEGLRLRPCGNIPTPAVTLYGLQNEIPSIMVTGSHIPEDRNGIKYNMPWGEVLKSDEAEISRRYEALKQEEGRADPADSPFTPEGRLKEPPSFDPGSEQLPAVRLYRERLLSFFPPRVLEGRRVVFYQHSSVSRDILPEMLRALGAEVIEVGRSATFVPVDTEAVENVEQLAKWVREHRADALVTTDGDGDRPLVVDERGKVIRGDVLGILVASFLRADSVSAPVSCNTALERCGRFRDVRRTRIGSPYVIEAMTNAAREGYRRVVGYEANGGFLTATEIKSEETGGGLVPLPTRDAALPILALLADAAGKGRPLSGMVSDLPARYTQSGLLRHFPTERGREIVERFRREGRALAEELFGGTLGAVEAFDFTDGARITFQNGEILHFRPSGNAPEFRCYTEAASEPRASEINRLALEVIRKTFAGDEGG